MSERFERSLILVALGALSALVLATTAAGAQPKVDAAALYKQHCALCHGPDGNSKLPNASFTDGVWARGSTEKDVQATIANGVKGTVMMGFSGKLKPEELRALTAHVRAYDKKLK
jgi:mono/diheme cytochrome c family protein